MSTAFRRASLLLKETPGASSSRSFSSSAVLQAGKTGGAKGGKKPAGGKRASKIGGVKKKDYEPKRDPKRVPPHKVVKLNHPLFTNTVDGQTLPPFEATALTPSTVGKVMAIPTAKSSPVSIFGMPTSLKSEFLNSPQPFSIIRQSTLDILDRLDKLEATPTEDNRLVLTGPSGSGKTVLLLQAVSYAASKEWIVFYAPHALKWVDASTPHAFDYRSRLFHQYELAVSVLNNLLQANGRKISNLKLSADVPMPGGKAGATLKAGTSLETLAQYGIKEPMLAPQTLVLLMEALGTQTQYPVLLAIDEFQALYNTSGYRDPQFKPLSSYHLSMPRLIMEYASGKRRLTRGALLGAVSESQHHYPVITPLKQALGLEVEIDPYKPARKTYAEFANGLKGFPIPPRFSPAEAMSLIETWNKNQAMHTSLNDSFFLTKYMETGGNPRELLRRGLISTLASQ